MSTPTYSDHQVVILIATNRSGSTMLAHCLDSHPDIHFERTEPLAIDSAYRHSTNDAMTRLGFALDRPGYLATGCKLSYKQIRKNPQIELRLRSHYENAKYIHLYRENPLRTIASSMVNRAVVDNQVAHPIHTYESPHAPAVIAPDPDFFISECYRYLANVRQMLTGLRMCAIDLMELTYERLAGENNEIEVLPPDISASLCTFIGVPVRPLTTRLRRVNNFPLSSMFSNWSEIKIAVAESRFAGWLENETA